MLTLLGLLVVAMLFPVMLLLSPLIACVGYVYWGQR